jgi:hypothetical protein
VSRHVQVLSQASATLSKAEIEGSRHCSGALFFSLSLCSSSSSYGQPGVSLRGAAAYTVGLTCCMRMSRGSLLIFVDCRAGDAGPSRLIYTSARPQLCVTHASNFFRV